MAVSQCVTVTFVILVTVTFVTCKVYEACELAKELVEVHDIPFDKVATWVCIAKHESDFNTSAVGHLNYDGSGDHGLFQISDLFWCSPPGNGWACGVTCNQLEDDDLEDDIACIKRIYNEHQRLSGDGFNAWAVYHSYCQGSRVGTYIDGCFDDYNTISPSNNTATKYQPTTTTPYTTIRKTANLLTSTFRDSTIKTPGIFESTFKTQITNEPTIKTPGRFDSTIKTPGYYSTIKTSELRGRTKPTRFLESSTNSGKYNRDTTTKSPSVFDSTSRFRYSTIKSSGVFDSTSRFRETTVRAPVSSRTTKAVTKRIASTTESSVSKKGTETKTTFTSRSWSFATWPGGVSTPSKSENKVKRNLVLPQSGFSSVGLKNTFGDSFNSGNFGSATQKKRENKMNKEFSFSPVGLRNTFGSAVLLPTCNNEINTNSNLPRTIPGFSTVGLKNTFANVFPSTSFVASGHNDNKIKRNLNIPASIPGFSSVGLRNTFGGNW